MVLKFIFVFILINYEFSFVPIWNFEKSTSEVFPSTVNSHDYTTYNFNGYKLVKRLKRGSNGKITSENILTINGGSEISVPYDSIDSVYYNKLGQANLVCPRGKYHPTNPNDGTQVIPTDFYIEGDWDLHCFEHSNPYYIYLAYYSNGQKNFYGNRNSGGPWEHNYVRSEWYAVKLKDYIIYNDHYPLMSLASDGGWLKLLGSEFTISTKEANTPMNRPDTTTVDIGLYLKSNTHAYFSDTDDTFYYVTYDSNSMISGYSTATAIDNYAYLKVNGQSVGNYLVKNEESPINFIDDVTIEDMDFIPGTNYLYYTLQKSDSTKYFGIIDIIANKVIFNTDQEITSIIPDDQKRLFIITPTSAYNICLYRDSNNNCLKSCSNNIIISTEGNTCGVSSSVCTLKLQPENVCISTCDTRFYIEKDGVCALCSYFKNLGKVTGEYKFIGSTQCIENKPDNSIYYNEHFKLLECDKGYKLDESTQTCVTNCYELCTTCNDFSNDPLNQDCKGCITGYELNNDKNCIKIIPTTVLSTEIAAQTTMIPSTEKIIETTILPTTEKIIETTMIPSTEKIIETTILPTTEKIIETTILPTTEKIIETTMIPSTEKIIETTILPTTEKIIETTILPTTEKIIETTILPTTEK